MHALDIAGRLGPGAVPGLEAAVRAYVAACKARSTTPEAVLTALELLVLMRGCRRGPGGSGSAQLAEQVVRWGEDAYHRED